MKVTTIKSRTIYCQISIFFILPDFIAHLYFSIHRDCKVLASDVTWSTRFSSTICKNLTFVIAHTSPSMKIRTGEFYARIGGIGILISNSKIFYASLIKNNYVLS